MLPERKKKKNFHKKPTLDRKAFEDTTQDEIEARDVQFLLQGLAGEESVRL